MRKNLVVRPLPHQLLIVRLKMHSRNPNALWMLRVAIPGRPTAQAIRHRTTWIERPSQDLWEDCPGVVPLNAVADIAIEKILGECPHRADDRCGNELHPPRIVRDFVKTWPITGALIGAAERISVASLAAQCRFAERPYLLVGAVGAQSLRRKAGRGTASMVRIALSLALPDALSLLEEKTRFGI